MSTQTAGSLRQLPENHEFNFRCTSDTCDMRCCTTGHPLVLSPFEIQKISAFTGISFDRLEDDYFEESHDPKTGFPLYTINRERGCRFLNGRICSVYSVRPLVCRLFPLGKLYDEGFTYVLLDENPCTGFESATSNSNRRFRAEQAADSYDSMWEIWVNFINEAEKIGMVDKSLFRSVFGMLVYNCDLPPPGISPEDAARMSAEALYRMRLAAAIEALPRLKSIFDKK
jgi:Fe-S-cluster containining protein